MTTEINFKATQQVYFQDQLDYDMVRQEFFNFFNNYSEYEFKDEADKNDFKDTDFYKQNKNKFMIHSWVKKGVHCSDNNSISYHISLKANDHFKKETFGVATPKKGTKTKYIFKFDDERIRPVEIILKKAKNVFTHNNVTYNLIR